MPGIDDPKYRSKKRKRQDYEENQSEDEEGIEDSDNEASEVQIPKA